MTYPGIRRGPTEVLDRITRGEVVNANEYYMRITPLFETSSDKYGFKCVQFVSGFREPLERLSLLGRHRPVIGRCGLHGWITNSSPVHSSPLPFFDLEELPAVGVVRGRRFLVWNNRRSFHQDSTPSSASTSRRDTQISSRPFSPTAAWQAGERRAAP
jgi:Protein of unknown function (DUF3237)